MHSQSPYTIDSPQREVASEATIITALLDLSLQSTLHSQALRGHNCLFSTIGPRVASNNAIDPKMDA